MNDEKPVEVSPDDLPLHCPPPGAALWRQHPRVFLDLKHSGAATCPYCSRRYVISGSTPKGQH